MKPGTFVRLPDGTIKIGDKVEIIADNLLRGQIGTVTIKYSDFLRIRLKDPNISIGFEGVRKISETDWVKRVS